MEKIKNDRSEGGFCPRNPLFSYGVRKSRSFAALRMTTKLTFFATSKAACPASSLETLRLTSLDLLRAKD
jgi:hypothetical protein